MTKTLFATGNQGKLREVRAIIGNVVDLVYLGDFPNLAKLEVEETGDTFRENAFIKAEAYSQASGLTVLAEDSGLEVEALGGRPGVRSARWVKGSDANRNQALLTELKGVKNRSARYVAVLCLLEIGKEPQYFEGELKGKIALSASGSGGFGYDPIFIPDGFDKTVAELGDEQKNQISHRKRALEKLRDTK